MFFFIFTAAAALLAIGILRPRRVERDNLIAAACLSAGYCLFFGTVALTLF